MPHSLRIATCLALPEPDPDEAMLLAGLARHGVAARTAPWRGGDEDWSRPIPTLVRSTWDYIEAVDAFAAWIERLEPIAPLWNPGPIMRANLHKRYLIDLAARGFPVVPTQLIPRGFAGDAAERIAALGSERFVIKPAVGAGSFATQRYRQSELPAAREHVSRLSQQYDVLLQPYLPSVEGHGERAIVCIDGRLSHAVRKSPRFMGQNEQVSAAVPIGQGEGALAERLLELYPALLYARVDVAPGLDGQPCLMELELVEPSLFLRQHPPALERLCAAIHQRLSN
jgi:hypothetical protein